MERATSGRLVAGYQAALGRLEVDPVGIGVSGQMHGLVCLDSADRIIRPAILWNDQRAVDECARLEELVPREQLLALTGNRALPGFTAPKLLWLREQESESYRRVASILLPKDFVRLRLTGEKITDVADASGTLLFDVAARAWSTTLIGLLDFEASWLPPALESATLSGMTKTGVPVAAGAGDQAAGALGVGVVEPGVLSIVLGSSGVVFAVMASFSHDAVGNAHCFCHAVPGQWHAMGVMLSAASALAWLRNAFGATPDFEELLSEAEISPPGARGLLFAPYLDGERTPHADAAIRGAFVGLSSSHNRGDLVRAVLEGVAYGLRDCFEVLRRMGIDADHARISGGGARSELWTRIVASTLGVPIERTTLDEGAAFGAALLGGVAAGVFPDVGTAVTTAVRPTLVTEPNAAWEEVYASGYERFVSLYPLLRSIPDVSEAPKRSQGYDRFAEVNGCK
jgi:xylulokinase